MKTFKVRIPPAHHAHIDIPHPIGFGEGECQSDDNQQCVRYGCIEDGLKKENEYDGDKHRHQRKNALPFVAQLVLAGNLLVEG